MNKPSSIKYLVIGALLSCAVLAPVASAVSNRPAAVSVPAPVAGEPIMYVESVTHPAVDRTVRLEEITVTPRAKLAPRKAVAARATVMVRERSLEQGGSPDAGTVIAWSTSGE